MKKSIKNWLWVMVIGFVIIAMILVLTGCFGEKVAKAEETQATTEASGTTTEDTTQTAILAELKNLNKSIGDLKSSLSTEEATETTEAEVATTTEETTAETTVKEVTKKTTVQTTQIVEETRKSFIMGWNTSWHNSIVNATDQLPDKLTRETFAEPGTFPGMEGRQTAWDKMENETTFMQAIEGGGLYIATGGIKLYLVDENNEKILIVDLPFKENTIYLIFVRGLPADGTSKDLNRTILATDYKPGHSINHVMPAGAYFSLDWTLDQVINGFKSPNCGEGCFGCIVDDIDLATRTCRTWVITDPENPRDWQRIDSL